MGARLRALLGARLCMLRRNGLPVQALVFQAVLAAVLAGLVRDALPPFPYALFALSVGALLLALPLLADLGALLRRDEGGEWIAALPATAGELRLARVLHLVLALSGLALSWFVPCALFAPGALGLARLALPCAGLGLALVLAALLVWAQELLLERARGLFVLLETALVVAIVVGLLQLLGRLPELAQLTPASPGLVFFPPAWFAAALSHGEPLPALFATLVAALALWAVPSAARPEARRAGGFERALAPLRALAARLWVRRDERASFELVFAALPREREVALRTYPMLGIPLAFLLVGASAAESATWRGDLLALLFFTTGIYLPLLLTHVPLSESPEASWLLRLAPTPRGALVNGTLKALYVRWILPLYLALAVLGFALGEAALVLRLWPLAAVLVLPVLRLLYARLVRELPLSTAPEDLRADTDWIGLVTTLAVAATFVAVAARRLLTPGLAAALFLLAVGVELVLDRRLRRRLG